MKRRALKLLLFLLLFLVGGAIINVAVAWYFQSRNPRPSISWRDVSPSELQWWGSRCPEKLDHVPKEVITFDALGQRLWKLRTLTGDGAREGHCVVQVMAGWPCLSMYFEWWRHQDTGLSISERGKSHLRFNQKTMPLLPIWPGFAINTIFYAAIVWAVYAVPGYIKRRRRIKRGLCPACAYPVGATDRCTECGAAVSHIA